MIPTFWVGNGGNVYYTVLLKLVGGLLLREPKLHQYIQHHYQDEHQCSLHSIPLRALRFRFHNTHLG